jgi:hypothetical protein
LARLGRVEEERLAPDQPGVAAELHDALEAAAEAGQAEALADSRPAGVVGQRLVEVVAQAPPTGQAAAGRLDQPAPRPDALEGHDVLQPDSSSRSRRSSMTAGAPAWPSIAR